MPSLHTELKQRAPVPSSVKIYPLIEGSMTHGKPSGYTHEKCKRQSSSSTSGTNCHKSAIYSEF